MHDTRKTNVAAAAPGLGTLLAEDRYGRRSITTAVRRIVWIVVLGWFVVVTVPSRWLVTAAGAVLLLPLLVLFAFGTWRWLRKQHEQRLLFVLCWLGIVAGVAGAVAVVPWLVAVGMAVAGTCSCLSHVRKPAEAPATDPAVEAREAWEARELVRSLDPDLAAHFDSRMPVSRPVEPEVPRPPARMPSGAVRPDPDWARPLQECDRCGEWASSSHRHHHPPLSQEAADRIMSRFVPSPLPADGAGLDQSRAAVREQADYVLALADTYEVDRTLDAYVLSVEEQRTYRDALARLDSLKEAVVLLEEREGKGTTWTPAPGHEQHRADLLAFQRTHGLHPTGAWDVDTLATVRGVGGQTGVDAVLDAARDGQTHPLLREPAPSVPYRALT